MVIGRRFTVTEALPGGKDRPPPTGAHYRSANQIALAVLYIFPLRSRTAAGLRVKAILRVTTRGSGDLNIRMTVARSLRPARRSAQKRGQGAAVSTVMGWRACGNLCVETPRRRRANLDQTPCFFSNRMPVQRAIHHSGVGGCGPKGADLRPL